ncbi:MAG TPA: glucosaminidase domain-containing protein, partial [Bacteroidia bacterium]|nr:glucosaminidase domain-containing protein [Bacteroidia bacterium]
KVICINADCENYLGSTKMVRDHKRLKNGVVISVFALYLLFSFDDFSMQNKEMQTCTLLAPPVDEIPLTVENLEAELESQNVICSREVLAQIKLESGNLGSFLLKRTNNMLGMRFPFSRKTTACGIYLASNDTIIYGTQKELRKYMKTNNYAVFNSWQDAVADYKLWQEACFKVTERYLTFLGNVYAEDSLYTKKIKNVAAKQDLK